MPAQPFSKTIEHNRIILKSLENGNLRESYIQLLLNFDNSTASSLDIQRNILKVFSSLRNLYTSSKTCRNRLFQIAVSNLPFCFFFPATGIMLLQLTCSHKNISANVPTLCFIEVRFSNRKAFHRNILWALLNSFFSDNLAVPSSVWLGTLQ